MNSSKSTLDEKINKKIEK